jgi:hypothetical protein
VKALKLNLAKEIFTTGDIARICAVSSRTVAKWFNAGVLEGYRIPMSRDRRVPRESLLRFMREHGISTDRFGDALSRDVLVVGADAGFAEALGESLVEMDLRFAVRTVSSACSAGAVACRYPPESLVVDLAIGRLDAGTIIHVVREISPMCVCCAIASGEDPNEVIRSTNCDVVRPKPVDIEGLALWLMRRGK